MDRRQLIKTTTAIGLGTVAGIRLGTGRSNAAEELRVLTWEGYAEDAWVKPFEEENGATVTKTYVGSNDEYMAKLAAGGGGYDLVVIVSSLSKRAIDAGFVEALDPALTPTSSRCSPSFRTRNSPPRTEPSMARRPSWPFRPSP